MKIVFLHDLNDSYYSDLIKRNARALIWVFQNPCTASACVGLEAHDPLVAYKC